MALVKTLLTILLLVFERTTLMTQLPPQLSIPECLYAAAIAMLLQRFLHVLSQFSAV